MRLYFESIAFGAQPKSSVPTHKFESNKKGENGGTPTRKLDNFSPLPRRSPSVVFEQASIDSMDPLKRRGFAHLSHTQKEAPLHSYARVYSITENIFTEWPRVGRTHWTQCNCRKYIFRVSRGLGMGGRRHISPFLLALFLLLQLGDNNFLSIFFRNQSRHHCTMYVQWKGHLYVNICKISIYPGKIYQICTNWIRW